MPEWTSSTMFYHRMCSANMWGLQSYTWQMLRIYLPFRCQFRGCGVGNNHQFVSGTSTAAYTPGVRHRQKSKEKSEKSNEKWSPGAITNLRPRPLNNRLAVIAEENGDGIEPPPPYTPGRGRYSIRKPHYASPPFTPNEPPPPYEIDSREATDV